MMARDGGTASAQRDRRLAGHARVVTVERVDTCTSGLWADLVVTRPSDLFHAPAWHQVLRNTYGFEVEGRVLVDGGGTPYAGWASCRIDDLRGSRIVGLPFSDYADPLVDDAVQWSALTDDLDARVPVRTRSLRTGDVACAGGFVETARAMWHGVALDVSHATLWERLAPGSRRAVRKAERDGVSVRETTELADVRTFFELHLGVRKHKYRLLAQPYRFFEAIHAQFLATGQGTLLLADVDGRPVAGVLLLRWRDRAYYKFNASRADGLESRPNDLLMWACIRYAKAQGCALLDLGLTDWDQHGLVRYKRKFASEESAISLLERPGDTRGEMPRGGATEMLSALTGLFTESDVPDALTERAGDLLYRYFV